MNFFYRFLFVLGASILYFFTMHKIGVELTTGQIFLVAFAINFVSIAVTHDWH